MTIQKKLTLFLIISSVIVILIGASILLLAEKKLISFSQSASESLEIMTVLHEATLAEREARSAINEIIISSHGMTPSIIEQLDQDFKSAAGRFNMFVSAMQWGTDSSVFSTLNNGQASDDWERYGWKGKVNIAQPSEHIRQYASRAKLYFHGVSNKANSIIGKMRQRTRSTNKTLHEDDIKSLFRQMQYYQSYLNKEFLGLTDEIDRRTNYMQQIIDEYKSQQIIYWLILLLLLFVSITMFSRAYLNRYFSKPFHKLDRYVKNLSLTSLEDIPKELEGQEFINIATQFRNIMSHLKQTSVSRDELLEQINKTEKAEKILQLSQSANQLIIDTANEAFITIDDHLRVINWNSEARRIFGWRQDEIRTKRIHQILFDTDHAPSIEKSLKEWVKANPLHKAEKLVQLKMKKRDETLIDVEATMWPTQVGSAVHLNLLIRDIFEERALEQSKKDKEYADLKYKFISKVSHALRAPMAAIQESIRIVIEGPKKTLSDSQQEMMQIAINNIERLTRLLDDVMEYQALGSEGMKIHRTKESLNDLIENVVKLQSANIKHKSIQIDLGLSKNISEILIDKDKITQVMINLIENAIRFTEEGSIIISSRMGVDKVRVSVTDTGSGIKSSDIPNLFHNFSSLHNQQDNKSSKTGMGLAICKQIIDLHEGDLGVKSVYGQGSTFWFDLPLKLMSKSD